MEVQHLGRFSSVANAAALVGDYWVCVCACVCVCVCDPKLAGRLGMRCTEYIMLCAWATVKKAHWPRVCLRWHLDVVIAALQPRASGSQLPIVTVKVAQPTLLVQTNRWLEAAPVGCFSRTVTKARCPSHYHSLTVSWVLCRLAGSRVSLQRVTSTTSTTLTEPPAGSTLEFVSTTVAVMKLEV